MYQKERACFLCYPGQKLVYKSSQNFYAMLGLGPVLEGYTVVASFAHLTSMLDLTEELAEERCIFVLEMRRVLNKIYGPCIITEHGRVPASNYYDPTHYDPTDYYDSTESNKHHYHAHSLVFPIDLDLTPSLHEEFSGCVSAYDSFHDARQYAEMGVEYLYYEKPNGSCLLVVPKSGFRRRYFRHLVAEQFGCPQIEDWHEYPGWDRIEAAQKRLKP